MEMRNKPQVIPSSLSDGWHPGFLIHISEEPTPPDWKMYQQSQTMWRWHFVVWQEPSLCTTQPPEAQSGLSSAKFSPKGKYQASKAYLWTKQILGHDIPPGQSVQWDDLYPAPCRIKVEREAGKDFIKVLDVEAWPDGAGVAVSLKDPLARARAEAIAAPVPVIPPMDKASQSTSSPPIPPAAHAVAAGMQSWGTQHGAPAPTPTPTPQPVTSGKKAW